MKLGGKNGQSDFILLYKTVAKYFIIFMFYFHSLNLSYEHCHSKIKIDNHRDIVPLKI